MMKKLIKNYLSVDFAVCDWMTVLLMVPVISVATTLYSALFCVLFSALLVCFNFCISALFNKFNVDINILSVVILLNGAVSIAVSAIAEPLLSDSFTFCFASMVCSLYFAAKFSKNKGNGLILNISKGFAFFSSFIITLSVIREILSSGAILRGFTENGFVLFSHKFGDYINSSSAMFLILAAVSFVLVIIFGEKEYVKSEKGSAKVIFWSLITSIMIAMITFALSKLFVAVKLPILSLLVPFLLAAVAVYLFGLICELRSAELMAALSLVFSVYVNLRADTFSEIMLIFALVFVSVMLAAIWAEVLYNDKKCKLTTTSILLVYSLIALIYEKII